MPDQTATIRGRTVHFIVPDGSDEKFQKAAAKQAYYSELEKQHGSTATGKEPWQPKDIHPVLAAAANTIGAPIQSMMDRTAAAGERGADPDIPWWRKTLADVRDTANNAFDVMALPYAARLAVNPKQIWPFIKGIAGYTAGNVGGQAAAGALGAPQDVQEDVGMAAGLALPTALNSPKLKARLNAGVDAVKRTVHVPASERSARFGLGGLAATAGYGVGTAAAELAHIPAPWATGGPMGAVAATAGPPFVKSFIDADTSAKPWVGNLPKNIALGEKPPTPNPDAAAYEQRLKQSRDSFTVKPPNKPSPAVFTPGQGPLPGPTPEDIKMKTDFEATHPSSPRVNLPKTPIITPTPQAAPIAPTASVTPTPAAPVQPPAPVAQRPLVSAPVQAPPVQAAPPPVQAPVQAPIQAQASGPIKPPIVVDPTKPALAPLPGGPGQIDTAKISEAAIAQDAAKDAQRAQPPTAPKPNMPQGPVPSTKISKATAKYVNPEAALPELFDGQILNADRLQEILGVDKDTAKKILVGLESTKKAQRLSKSGDFKILKGQAKVEPTKLKVEPPKARTSEEHPINQMKGPTDAELGPKDNVVTDEDRAMGKAARKVNPPTKQREIIVNKPGEKPDVSKETETTQKAPDAEQPAEDKGSSGSQQEQKDQNAKTVVKNYDKAALGFSDSAHVDRALFAALGKTKLPRAEWKKFYASEFPGVESLDDMSTNQKLHLIEKVTGKELHPKDKGKPFPESSFGKDSKTGKYGFGF